MLGDPAVCLSALIASYWTWHFSSVVEAGDAISVISGDGQGLNVRRHKKKPQDQAFGLNETCIFSLYSPYLLYFDLFPYT